MPGSPTNMEFDFFEMEKQQAQHPGSPPSGHVESSRRRFQRVVSRINPLLLKTVMTGAEPTFDPDQGRSGDRGANPWATGKPLGQSPSSVVSPTAAMFFSPLPVLSPSSRSSLQGYPESPSTPLTIFYNGVVTAFDVPQDKAEAVIRMAASCGLADDDGARAKRPSLEGDASSTRDHMQVEENLPITRSKSLQRFLEKRKERLNEMGVPPCAGGRAR